MSGIAGLVLAAGESSRMGRDKALVEYRGKTFLDTILANLRQSGIFRIVVVLGYHAAEIQRQADLSGVEVIVNAAYRQGQTSSLQAGLQALAAADIDGALLSLVDHPAAGPEVMRELTARFLETRAPVVIPVYQGRRGHPVVIGRALFPELMNLGPGQGASTVIRRHHAAAQWLEVEDPGVILDIDDPEDYRRLTEQP